MYLEFGSLVVYCEGHQFAVDDAVDSLPKQTPKTMTPYADGWQIIRYPYASDPWGTTSPHWYCPECVARINGGIASSDKNER